MKSLFYYTLALAVALSLSSCAGSWEWHKEGATADDFTRDYAEAEYHAEVGTLSLTNSPYSSPFLNQYQKMGESAAQGVTRGLERLKLINMYMKMKGWEKVSVKKQALTNSKDLLAFMDADDETLKNLMDEPLNFVTSKKNTIDFKNAFVTADKIEVITKDTSGKPTKVRAIGNVVYQNTSIKDLSVVCADCFMTPSEVIFRGPACIKRGDSLIRNIQDAALFNNKTGEVKIIGPHRLINRNGS